MDYSLICPNVQGRQSLSVDDRNRSSVGLHQPARGGMLSPRAAHCYGPVTVGL